MKRLIGLILSLVCILGLAACTQQQNTEENGKGELYDFSENKDNSSGEEPSNADFISQERAEEIALTQCKVNYDYIKTEFDDDLKQWRIEFWEKTAKYVPAQRIYVDRKGNITNIVYAE